MTNTAQSLVTLLVSLITPAKGDDVLSVADLREVAREVSAKTGPVAYARWAWDVLVCLIPHNAGKFTTAKAEDEEVSFFKPMGKAKWSQKYTEHAKANPGDTRTLFEYVRDAFAVVGVDKDIPATVAGLDFSQSPSLTSTTKKEATDNGPDKRSLRSGFVNSWNLTAEMLKGFGERIIAEYVSADVPGLLTKSPGRLLLALNINIRAEGDAEDIPFSFNTEEVPGWTLDAEKVLRRCIAAAGKDNAEYSFPARQPKA